MTLKAAGSLSIFASVLVMLAAWGSDRHVPPGPAAGERIVLIGNGLGHRMEYFPHFETQLHMQYSEAKVVVRNLSRPGDTPGYRPHSSRPAPWAFPGAERFHPDKVHRGAGRFPSPDEWLTTLRADTVVAFFGLNESFDGQAGLQNFRGELAALVEHTRSQKYNGRSSPRMVLVSPIPFEDLSARGLSDGRAENANLQAYARTMEQVAADHGVEYVDVYEPMLRLYRKSKLPLTINGISLTDTGYRQLATILRTAIYGRGGAIKEYGGSALFEAVKEKNWLWLSDYGMLNDIHSYGRRVEPFGSDNYPEEIQKVRQMTALHDERIHALVRGGEAAPIDDTARTLKLSEIKTNFNLPIKFLDEDKAIERFQLPKGFKINLFASEMEFPDLKNPVELGFDSRGRLWVAVAPSYPHWRPGDARPNDKLLVLEDTDADGRADKSTVFADGLHLPLGFELAAEGVYVAQQPNLILLADDDGDGRADRREILLHGFDPHDSHHAISAFAADASGALYMNEGTFLHTQVETPYGPQRGVGGGVWRFDPKSWRVERYIQTSFANPWGFVFDEWDQPFVSDASNGDNWWGLPLSTKMRQGAQATKYEQFTTQRVRPTAGSEFISSRHFPAEYQGDFLINNTIGYLGTKQHQVVEDDSGGYTGRLRQDLVQSSDPNFRPVAIETAPDGSLFIVDWHNPLVGHMQHSVRDPNRDHDHGRIYRVTHESMKLVEPAVVAGASTEQLLDNLLLPEYRSRYRSRRELRGRPVDEVLRATRTWVAALDTQDANYERWVTEALWVTWAQNRVDAQLLEQCLRAKDHRARAAAARVLRFAYRQVPQYRDLFLLAAADSHPRVRLEAVVAASWLDNADGAAVALEALKFPITRSMGRTFEDVLRVLDDDIRQLQAANRIDLTRNPAAAAYLAGNLVLYTDKVKKIPDAINLKAEHQAVYLLGEEVYRREGHCGTCHGEDGMGAVANVYPPLGKTPWVVGDVDRLIKLVLKGLYGPIQVGGKTYDPANGVPPMTGFEGLLNDAEVAAVLTYVRMRFGRVGVESNFDQNGLVDPEAVRKVREAIKEQRSFYDVEKLLAEHPLEKQ